MLRTVYCCKTNRLTNMEFDGLFFNCCARVILEGKKISYILTVLIFSTIPICTDDRTRTFFFWKLWTGKRLSATAPCGKPQRACSRRSRTKSNYYKLQNRNDYCCAAQTASHMRIVRGPYSD